MKIRQCFLELHVKMSGCFLRHSVDKLFLCLQVIQDFVTDLSKHIEDVDRSVVVCVLLSVACCVTMAEVAK